MKQSLQAAPGNDHSSPRAELSISGQFCQVQRQIIPLQKTSGIHRQTSPLREFLLTSMRTFNALFSAFCWLINGTSSYDIFHVLCVLNVWLNLTHGSLFVWKQGTKKFSVWSLWGLSWQVHANNDPQIVSENWNASIKLTASNTQLLCFYI